MKTVTEFYNEQIAEIAWFSKCGEETDLTLHYDFSFVNNWKEAEKSLNSRWDNFKLEIRNGLTVSLHKEYLEAYRQWNSITIEAKKLLKNGALNDISLFAKNNNLNESVYESVEWDLLTAMMEYAYSPYIEPGFYTELLKVYQSGHIPCGWKGKWPEGQLLVF
ncbi:hypothetical protein SAMN04487969_103327 [Paenibacillus algorifonticola]|uniref:Uncharacterized protein n=1 Tax=Paenibacillus algorifonticola TaxID=684063 RepID=A0A1I2BFH1_9BACL|nr:hypothetical protein [Paenibacillus algorifonticola]SFE54707.1 hypothetical protein SAMN04487969_103327 [Paenibacillus algorifonticola]